MLSTCKLVHVYLASSVMVDQNSGIHELNFEGFWEALVRTAMLMYNDPRNSDRVPMANQLRGLFLWMFRAINGELQEFVSGQFDTKQTTKDNRFIRPAVCKLFTKIFIADWQKTNFTDYGLYDDSGVYHTSHAEAADAKNRLNVNLGFITTCAPSIPAVAITTKDVC